MFFYAHKRFTTCAQEIAGNFSERERFSCSMCRQVKLHKWKTKCLWTSNFAVQWNGKIFIWITIGLFKLQRNFPMRFFFRWKLFVCVVFVDSCLKYLKIEGKSGCFRRDALLLEELWNENLFWKLLRHSNSKAISEHALKVY